MEWLENIYQNKNIIWERLNKPRLVYDKQTVCIRLFKWFGQSAENFKLEKNLSILSKWYILYKLPL